MGNVLSHAETKKEVETHGNEHFKVAVASMMGYRDAMEDAHCIQCTDEFGLFGVFDGHAGSECATYCAANLGKELEKCPTPIDDDAIVKVVLDLDKAVRGKNRSGSTACFVLATGAGPGKYDLQVANVGDSRCLIGRNGGEDCTAMTVDHRPTNETERRRIESCGGFVEADRVDGTLAVARALGDDDYKRGPGGPLKQKVTAQPDITHATCTTDDLVVIACDGVFEGRFRNNDVMKFIKSQLKSNNNDLAATAAAVCDEALRRGSTDNITCMIIQFADGSEMESGSSTILRRSSSSSAASKTKTKLNSVADRAGSTVDSMRSRMRTKRAPSSDPVGPSIPLGTQPARPLTG